MKHIENVLENFNLLVWTVFPTVETFHDLKNDRRNITFIEKMTGLALKNNSLQKGSEEEFLKLIQRAGDIYKDRKSPAGLHFEALINEIKKEVSVKSLVRELEDIAHFFGLEKPNEVTFTRLKQDFQPGSFKKQHALMALAIWLCANKPELGLNYAAIIAFPRYAAEAQPETTEGIRMELSFFEPRGNIDPSVMDFLKNTLPQCAGHLDMHYLTETRVQFLATACVLRIPVKQGFADIPQNYGHGLRDALSLAHQLMISWQLTPFYPTTIQFIIAIDAGAFSVIADSIKDLLQPSLHNQLPVRLSHWAYMISRQLDMRVIFKATQHPNVWCVEDFWCFPYFRSPLALLPTGTPEAQPGPLPVRDQDMAAFQDALFFTKSGVSPILDAIRRYPPKVTLALEVAHIATLRRMGHEAVQILSSVLSFEPYNPIALTMRMQNLFSLANYADDWNTASLLYDRALCDGIFFEKYCPPNPVFYAIYGLLFYSKAVKMIRSLRKGVLTDHIEDRKKEAIDCMAKAEFYNRMGLTASHNAADNRCAFWIGHYYAFRKLLINHPAMLTDKTIPFADPDDTYIREMNHVYKSMGMLNPHIDRTLSEQIKDLRLMFMLENYLTSISAKSHYANVLFSATTMLWDFTPHENKPFIIDMVLMYLDLALSIAASLKESCLGVYICTEVQSPGEFIRGINTIKAHLEKIKQTGDYANPAKISLMNLDDDTNAAPITFDLIEAEEKDENAR